MKSTPTTESDLSQSSELELDMKKLEDDSLIEIDDTLMLSKNFTNFPSK